MSFWLKILSVVLVVAAVAMVFPQKLDAKAQSETIDPQMAALSQSSMAMAAGLINPALGAVFNSTAGLESEPTSGALNKPEVKTESQATPAYSTGKRNSGLDIDALIAAAPPSPREGLTLVTRYNTWATAPQNHNDLATCVDEESAVEDGWYWVGIVSQINQSGNPWGTSSNYTAYYETFFQVTASNSGNWSFATDSNGASDIEIDGAVAAAWYGEHTAANAWSHNGTFMLSTGWHRLVYRSAALAGTPATRAAFRKPGDSTWNILGTSALTLKPVNLDEGILLTTGANTWTTDPQNHTDMTQCVESGISSNTTAPISYIVKSIYQDNNPYLKNAAYTSLYETFFYADVSGNWFFATDSAGASEIEIDDVVATSWYGGHAASNSWSHNGTVSLSTGWHRLVYRNEYLVGGGIKPLASAAFKKPGDSAVSNLRDLSTAQLTLKGACRSGTDGDNLPDSVEAVLGTDPANMDSDGDLLDDYFELKNGLDPLEADSNDDGIGDYREINGSDSTDVDGDGIPNAWDDDNDNDGVPDSLDASPFAQSKVSDKFQFHIQGDGSPTYAEFQVRPENAAHLKLDTQTRDWPDDSAGSMQDLDKSKDDVQINPMLEMTLDHAPQASEVKDYGITVADQAVAFNQDNPWSSEVLSPVIGDSSTGGGTAIYDINGNGKPDMILTNIDDPTGSSKFRYMIGWDSGADGKPASWSSTMDCPISLGWTRINQDLNQGAKGKYIYLCVKQPLVDKIKVISGFSSPGSGWTKCDIDLNKGAGGDYLYLWIKNELVGQVTVDTGSSTPDGGGWHKIDKDLNEGAGGEFIYLWVRDSVLGLVDVISGDSSDIQHGENAASGSGAAVADINHNGRPDLVLMALDASNGPDQLRYIIGWDMNAAGAVTNWSTLMQAGSLGDSNAGAGAAIADINGNGKPDLLLMGIDNPNGANQFRYRIGWDLAADGTTNNWSSYKKSPDIAFNTAGGGAAVADIDGNGKKDLVLMAVDSTTRGNRFEYLVGWDLDGNGNPASWSPSMYQGWTRIYSNLNDDGRGAYIYLCVREQLEGLIKVINGSSPDITPGAGWTKLPGNLNAGVDRSQYIYLCVKGLLVDQLKIISGSSASITPGDGWTKLDQNLNQGCGGDYVYLCVKNELAGQFKIVAGSTADVTADPDIIPLGGGAAVADIDGNGKPELFLVRLDERYGGNSFRLIVGRDMRPATKVYVPLLPVDDKGSTVAYNGKMFFPAQNKPRDVNLEAKLVWMVSGKSDLTGLSWGNMQFKGGLGYDNAGGGTAIGDINGNGIPDLLLMSIDNPAGANSFRWTIGWDVGSDGQPVGWSPMFSKGGLGWENSGGGAAIADINGNGKPDLLLMGIDAASGGDAFNYVIGWDMDASGQPAGWSQFYSKGGLGDITSGGGAAVEDINGNGIPDLLLMGIDNPSGGDSFRYYIGWDLNASGQPARWSDVFSKGGLGDSDSGGGAAIADLNGNGRPELVLMGIDNPEGGNSFRYMVGWDMDTSGVPAGWSEVFSKGGLGGQDSGGGAALADIDGNGIPDLLLMGVDNPQGADSFWYNVGWNFGTESRNLARYKENFKLTGFTITENHGCEAGLFYSDDMNQTLRTYPALRYEFLDSNNTVSQAAGRLATYNITITSDVRQFSHSDAAIKDITGSMIADALHKLGAGKTLPVAFAMSNTSVTEGMDTLAANSRAANSYNINFTAAPQVTVKSIKLPWYNTTTREMLDAQGVMRAVDSWNWSTDEKASASLLLLSWSAGETNITKMGSHEILPDTPEKEDVLSLITHTYEMQKFLQKKLTFLMHTGLFASILAPMLPAIVREFISGLGKISSYWGSGKSFWKIPYKFSYYTNDFNPLRRAVLGEVRWWGSDEYIGPARLGINLDVWAKAMKIIGRVLIVAAILFILGEFIYASAKSGWTRLGTSVAGMYAAMEFIYLVILIAIACIPLVGWAISLAIMIIDLIFTILGTGSSWIMGKIIDALVDISLRSDVNLDTLDISMEQRDYDDNGLTSGDLIEMSSRIMETVKAVGDGNSGDVSKSYISPHYEYSVSGAARSGKFLDMISQNNQGNWKTVTHETGVWLIPQARINLPLTIWLHSDYRVYYDETIAGSSEYKSESGSTDSDRSILYYDVLPSTLDDFVSWSALTCNDSDGDNLKDSVEAGTGVYNQYQVVNKDSGLSLAAQAASGNQTELAVYQGVNNQRWVLVPDLPAGQCALKAGNGKYMKIDPAAYDLGANGANIQDGLKFYLVNTGNQTAALKTTDGRYISRGSSDGLYPAWTDMTPETRFTVEYLGGQTIALKAGNGKYVSVWASGGSILNQLRATANSIGDTEKFTLDQSGWYKVQVTSDNKVLSIIDVSSTEGAKVTTRTYGYDSDQSWMLESAGGGYYRLVNRRSGLCLGVSGKGVAGADAVQESYTGADDQKWKLEPAVGISNKAKWDTDADGLPDGFEIRNYMDYGTSATVSDTDGDGLNDKVELDLGTDPGLADTDGDNLSDKAEVAGWMVSFTYNGKAFTEHVWPDPLTVDSDGDGLTDYQEYRNGFNPRSKDTDGDGIPDAEEAKVMSIVAGKGGMAKAGVSTSSSLDSDGDGLPDIVEETGWQISFTDSQGAHSGNVTSDPMLADSDFDGLGDAEEYAMRTNPGNVDTDGDGLNDAVEKQLGTDPNNYDSDGDGLDDGSEVSYGSDPLKADTDNDGLNDAVEVNGWEITYSGAEGVQTVLVHSNPLLKDTDGDGLDDAAEKQRGTNPSGWDTDKDGLGDLSEINGWDITYTDASGEHTLHAASDPLQADSNQDGFKDYQAYLAGTNPLSSDTDGDGLKDVDEVELWTNPLNTDSDGDGLTDGEEVTMYGTNPLSADSDHDGQGDKADSDTYAANPAQIYVLYDKGTADYSQFIKGLSQYTTVISGNLTDIPDYKSKPYLVVLGYPEDAAGTAAKVTYDTLTEDVRADMEKSDLYRMVRGVNVWEGNKMVIMLSQPYHSDYYRVLASIKGLIFEVTPNSVWWLYPEARKNFFLEAIKEIDFYFNVNLINRVTPEIKITRYDAGNPLLAEVKPLTQANGLGADEVAVGKYMDIWVSDNIQSGNFTNIESAEFKIYYTAGELDRNGNGNCTDAGDINESTLSLYSYNGTAKYWTKVSGNQTGVNTTNIQPYSKAYEGYVQADVDHFSLYGLAGKTIPGGGYIVYPPMPQPVVTATAAPSPTPAATPLPSPTVTPPVTTQAKTTPAATTLPPVATTTAAATVTPEPIKPSPGMTSSAAAPVVSTSATPVKAETPASTESGSTQRGSNVWLIVGIILGLAVVATGSILAIRLRKKPRK